MDLRFLGWNAHWRDLFASYVPDRLHPGRIVAEHRGGYVVEMESGSRGAALGGRLRHQTTTRSELPAVGDFVALRLSTEGQADGPAVIDAVLPRRTAFVRRSAGTRSDDQVIAANVDIVFVMLGLDHDFNVRRTERYLAAVWDSGAAPVLLLNKSDVCEALGERINDLQGAGMGVAIHPISALNADGLDAVRQYLREGVTVSVVGSSGVGKSTLLNRLLGRDAQTTAGVRSHDSHGRHTTTHRELFVLPEGGLVIDTPGMREFQLSASGGDDLGAAGGVATVFADIEQLATECRFSDCAHQGEPGCAVRDAVDDGRLDADRLTSYEKLVKELRYEEARSDPSLLGERKRVGRIGAKAARRMYRERRR
jgi:ribosome biogenesis GTPase / thiamine phosphate phosphatase